MIVKGTLGGTQHYCKAGGGKTRTSVCGKATAGAKSWELRGGGKVCEECEAIAIRKYGLKIVK